MNILIVTQYFWPENFRINDLAREFQKRGHRVTVLTGLPNYPSGRLAEGYSFHGPYREWYDGVEVLRSPLIPRGHGGGVRLALNYLSFALIATLRGLVSCSSDVDVIFVHEPSPVTVGFPAIAVKRVTGAPVLFWVLDLWPESVSATQAIRSPLILRWIERMVRFIYSGCDRILVQSQAFITHIESQRVSPDRIVYFPSWAETLFALEPLNRTLPEGVVLPEGFRVMFAGNVGEAQDFETILGAADCLRTRTDIHWIIVGDGRKLNWVHEQVRHRRLTDTVHLLGRHPLESMPAFFAQADAMLVTLRREPIFALTIPGKVQSYLASGRPIVAALDGEGARIVEDAGAGLACPAESPQALAAAVEKLAGLPKVDREDMGRRGRAYYAAHFERERLFDQLERWMHEAARMKGGTPSAIAVGASPSTKRGVNR